MSEPTDETCFGVRDVCDLSAIRRKAQRLRGIFVRGVRCQREFRAGCVSCEDVKVEVVTRSAPARRTVHAGELLPLQRSGPICSQAEVNISDPAHSEIARQGPSRGTSGSPGQAGGVVCKGFRFGASMMDAMMLAAFDPENAFFPLSISWSTQQRRTVTGAS